MRRASQPSAPANASWSDPGLAMVWAWGCPQNLKESGDPFLQGGISRLKRPRIWTGSTGDSWGFRAGSAIAFFSSLPQFRNPAECLFQAVATRFQSINHLNKVGRTRPQGDSMKASKNSTGARNVLGTPFVSCSRQPLTGFFRDGCCNTGPDDVGMHLVCSIMTDEFLTFSKGSGK